jgi:hypothetical protein
MTDDDDATKLAEVARELPRVDVDDASARRIAAVARASVGKGPPVRRFVGPVLVMVFTGSLTVWMIVKLAELLG